MTLPDGVQWAVMDYLERHLCETADLFREREKSRNFQRIQYTSMSVGKLWVEWINLQ